MQDKPDISPREWAQTAAIGIALRNAGFGLQFKFAGEAAGGAAEPVGVAEPVGASAEASTGAEQYETTEQAAPVDPLQAAMAQPCVIKKYAGKTLGDLITLDPGALTWIAGQDAKFPEIAAAARLICEYAKEQTA